jgi:RNA polymerase sigma factor (sigma-70 family)
MLTIDELDELPELSGQTLYKAEVQRIMLMNDAEEQAVANAARAGDQASEELLIHQCLRYVLVKARTTYADFRPAHTEVMDLVGIAHVSIMENLPNALASSNPMAYLLSVAAKEMRRACFYDDPLIPRTRRLPRSQQHPGTELTDMDALPIPESLPARPNEQLEAAVMDLSEKKRLVLIAVYGLFGQARKPRQEIAAELEMKPVTVDKYLYASKRKLAETLGWYVLRSGCVAE